MKELERLAMLYNEKWKNCYRVNTPKAHAAAEFYASAERAIYALLDQETQ